VAEHRLVAGPVRAPRGPVVLAAVMIDRAVSRTKAGVAGLSKDGLMGVIQLKAQLQPRGPAAAVVLDDAQVAAVGEGASRFAVVATVNGYTWRTSVARMGGEFLLGLNREVREGAGVEAGDVVDVTLELDAAPREVDVPEVLAAALAADPQAKASFDQMAFTHRKEYARWVADAKQEETRQRRVRQALEMIRAGKTRT
jgi:bacteriocin resistance YdeI/OmpD-like protein/uncharacterized protein DUF1905